MLGDGELQEGSVWEAAMAAVHHGTSNLKVIVDRNRIQNDDFCAKQLEMMDISESGGPSAGTSCASMAMIMLRSPMAWTSSTHVMMGLQCSSLRP